ncbi:MAG TPA: DNA (cytosine-5-)-methyltransferase [Actinomycetota bacterium]|nr:DNA (cytosine-5-)-methyltransferase [Actinomycetota bacterium]
MDTGKRDARPGSAGRVVELFAGVGGFRLGLEASGWETIWANQWEPSTKTQHAAECYEKRFGGGTLVNEDINLIVQQIDGDGAGPVPAHDLLVGGFPCQDYSVAKMRSQAHGIVGKKGVLWWAIYRILETKRPRLVLLENVDRLLKSPTAQRGRDFAIILACLSDLGYLVEWRVVNAADYGFPQRRRRVFLVAHHLGGGPKPGWRGPISWIADEGALARGLPIETPTAIEVDPPDIKLEGDLKEITDGFGVSNTVTPFLSAGVMWRRAVWTRAVQPRHSGGRTVLRDVLQPATEIPESFFIPTEQLERWVYLKGRKDIPRIAKNGHEYLYSEGGIAFPDPIDQPSRTILTGEGGVTPSRFKHVVDAGNGRLRRLTPLELERLNGFEDNWTDTGMPDGRRAFMMGNALVVGLVKQIGKALAH